MGNKGLYTAIAVVVIIVLAVVAYEKGWFNGILPSKWQKSTFVGAFGRTPEMQGCFVSDSGQKWPVFNRCTWA